MYICNYSDYCITLHDTYMHTYTLCTYVEYSMISLMHIAMVIMKRIQEVN